MQVRNLGLFAIFGIFLFIFTACSKNNEAALLNGAELFSATIVFDNGETLDWKAALLTTTYNEQEQLITLLGRAENTSSLLISVPDVEGSYTFVANPIESYAPVQAPFVVEFVYNGVQYVQGNDLSIVVDNLDVEGKTLSGSFSFTATATQNNAKITVTQGKFTHIGF